MRPNPYVVFLLLFAAAVATAGTIQNFAIVTASDMGPAGGTFSFGGGSFSGTFSVDESDLPTLVSIGVALPAVDLVTTPSTTNPPTFLGATYTSGTMYYGGEVYTVAGVSFMQPCAEYGIEFSTSYSYEHVWLYFISTPGSFEGGQILLAEEESQGVLRTDSSGDAVALDPAFLAPEPWTTATCGFSLLAIGLYRRRGFIADCRARLKG
jgi:hypothetical protein